MNYEANDSIQGERFIFIGGSPRSGTTLVQNILDCHPDVFGGPEFLHIPDIIKLRKALRASIDREWINLICSYEDVDRYLRRLIVDLLLPQLDRAGRQFLSEKTPENVIVLPEVVELFPKARFIHVVRDPRAIVASMLVVGQRARKKSLPVPSFTRNVHTAIAHLKKCFDGGFRAVSKMPDHIHTVIYERLVQDPEHETRKLCEYLGIDWRPEMLAPDQVKHAGEQAITVKSNELWYDKATYYSNPHTGSLEKWRASLTPAQQVTVCRAFANYGLLRDLGYDLSLNGLDKRTRRTGILGSYLDRFKQRLFHGIPRLFRKFWGAMSRA